MAEKRPFAQAPGGTVHDKRRWNSDQRVEWAEYANSLRNLLQLRQLARSGEVLSDDQLSKIDLIRAANLIQDVKEVLAVRPKKWASRQLASKEVELLMTELEESQNEWVELRDVGQAIESFQSKPSVNVATATESPPRSEYDLYTFKTSSPGAPSPSRPSCTSQVPTKLEAQTQNDV
ncbi:hypothetical protein QFC20_004410 [Naganishia adeliensis]|uniref:Uncharacterized protein n=1 Tax=Naganishia adeliensis TaxID=92952 RepID=A0ACC2W2V7_9TREE|nr:hypothetical protein QFC20_004410 [Naganishia adeliensis]